MWSPARFTSTLWLALTLACGDAEDPATGGDAGNPARTDAAAREHVEAGVVEAGVVEAGVVEAGAVEAGVADAGADAPPPDDGSAPGPDAGREPELAARNEDETVIDGDRFHPLGQDLIARFVVPAGDGPHPACIVLHGSGGLFREGALGEPCGEAIEANFAAIGERLAAAGVAALFPSSFYSRDPRFCEDNSEFIDFAPADYDRDKRRTVLRLYDLLAAAEFLCADARIDCQRLCLVGTSNGASILMHYLHDGLPVSFADFHADDAADIAPIPERPIPASRPMPRFSMAVSPGCGFQGAISFEADPADLPGTPDSDLYFPDSPVHLEIGDQDDVPDHCTYEVTGFTGTRQIQVEERLSRMGLGAADSPMRITIHPGGEHDLLGDPERGPAILDRFDELLASELR